MTRSSYLPLSRVKIGEPDANSEFFSALRTNSTPIFLDCFLSLPHFPTSEFLTGEKYIIYGQKGTGKTSILRYLERQSRQKVFESEFLIFKKTFLEEMDLADYARLPLKVDEDEIKKFKHFHHAVKRLLIVIILSKLLSGAAEVDIDHPQSETRGFLQRISKSSVGDAIKLGLDSIGSIFQSLDLDMSKITNDRLLLDGGRLLKRNNDDLLGFLIRRLRDTKRTIKIFIDEIHFAYRSEESLQQDAILVRDTILAVQSLNERFAEEKVDAVIYIAVRAEYLEHPIISTADINHAIESVGYDLTWSTFPLNRNHPLFEMIFLRFKKAIGDSLKKEQFFKVYLANIDPFEFLERTWSKPRDFVRFFKCAKEMYPTYSSLSIAQSNAVWKRYSQEAWREVKSAASPFMPPPAIALFEETLARIAPGIFNGSIHYTTADFRAVMAPIYDLAKGGHENFYAFDHFMRLLYILGVFSTRREGANDRDIFQSYHRGNRNFHANGDVLIHPTILKAFG